MVKGKRTTYGTTARRRTQERVHRLAYDFEDMARRARAGGFEGLADALQARASSLGDLARNDEIWRL